MMDQNNLSEKLTSIEKRLDAIENLPTALPRWLNRIIHPAPRYGLNVAQDNLTNLLIYHEQSMKKTYRIYYSVMAAIFGLFARAFLNMSSTVYYLISPWNIFFFIGFCLSVLANLFCVVFGDEENQRRSCIFTISFTTLVVLSNLSEAISTNQPLVFLSSVLFWIPLLVIKIGWYRNMDGRFAQQRFTHEMILKSLDQDHEHREQQASL